MIIIAWVLLYFVASFYPTLSWGNCDNDWNSENCFSTVEDIRCQSGNTGGPTDQISYRDRCRTVQSICEDNNLIGVNVATCMNQTGHEIAINQVITRYLSTEEFF